MVFMYCKGCGEHGHRATCKGSVLLAVGALVIANEYALDINWWYLFGGLLVLKGLLLLVCGGKCGCHKDCCQEPEENASNKKPKKG
ncbi:hypothetical protein J4439_02225 [Candidatus Woesearchaeota archaeon]|nr:hypothetical protein [Candidatus Woesearchaeota archaeon]